MALAEERKVDALAAGLLSVAAFMTVTPYSVGEAYAVGANWLGGANIITILGIIIGLVVAEMFTFIVRRNWVIKLPIAYLLQYRVPLQLSGFIILSCDWDYCLGVEYLGHQLPSDHYGYHLNPTGIVLGSVVGWAYVIFRSTALWFFGIHGALALTAAPTTGIMTPWALENIATYQQYGSVEAALAAGSTVSISGPSRCWTPLFSLGAVVRL